MRFEYPRLLWLLLLVVPALAVFFWWAWRTRKELIAKFVQSRLLTHLTVGLSARRQKVRIGLIVAAAALLVVVFARPQWGYTWEEAKQRGLDVVVAIDTSKSMLAPDIPPNRLERAKLAALDLKKQAKTDRVGLVAFAGTAFLQCPLSFDDEAFRQSLNALDVTIIPEGGTALAEAIQTALSAFKEKNENHKILVLFSDGEDHDGNALDAAKDAAKEGLKIFTIGVGTANGELIRFTDGKGKSDYVRDENGNVVKSHLNEKLLKEMAEATGGFYMLLTGANTIDMLYKAGLAPLPKAEHQSQTYKRYHERYQLFLGLVIVLLIMEIFLPERKRVQRSEGMGSAANLELRKALTVLICLLSPCMAWGSASPGSALKKYEAGKYDAALLEYQRVLREKPTDARIHFNAGSAAYRAKNFEEAQKQLNSALFTEDLQLQEKAYYNLGNTQFRLGEEEPDPSKKEGSWEQAISSYDSALRLNTNNVDAKFNKELVTKKLEELKQQQQQNKDQQNKDDKKDQKEDQKQDDQKKDDQKQDQQKKDEQKQDQQNSSKQDQQQQEQQKKDDQQKQQDSKKKDDEKKDQAQQGQKQQGEKGDEQQQGGKPRQVMQMTPEEAEKLLDMVKNQEKALIYLPPNRTNRNNRVWKDW